MIAAKWPLLGAIIRFGFTVRVKQHRLAEVYTVYSPQINNTGHITWQESDGFKTHVFLATPQTGTVTPDIKANGQDGPVIVSAGAPVSIDIGLNPGDQAGVNAKWWIVVQWPFGIFWNYYSLQTASFPLHHESVRLRTDH